LGQTYTKGHTEKAKQGGKIGLFLSWRGDFIGVEGERGMETIEGDKVARFKEQERERIFQKQHKLFP